MKNESMVLKASDMKRNIMIYLMIFAGGSLILKSLNHISINLESSMTEIYCLIMSLVIFLIQGTKKIGIPRNDENMIKERNTIYKIGFLIVLLGGIGMHFISMLLYGNRLLADSNTFTSLFILLGFIVAIISAKRYGFYLNQKSMEYKTKSYYISVLMTIGKLSLVATGYATIVYSLSLSQGILFDHVTKVWNSILLSLIFFSIEYLMVSIYEKIDYDEKMLYKEKQSQRYLSKKVILLGLPLIGFSIIRSGMNFLYWQQRLSGYRQNEMMIEGINGLLTILMIDFAIMGMLLSFVIYYSIKTLPVDKPKLFVAFPFLIWLNLIFTANYALISTYMYLYPMNVSETYLSGFTKITTLISLLIMAITLIIHIYMYPFLKKHNYPASKIFLVVPLFPLLSLVLGQLVNQLGSQISMIMYQESLIAFIFVLITSFAYYFIYCSMSNEIYKKKEDQKRQLESQVVLSKKLIH